MEEIWCEGAVRRDERRSDRAEHDQREEAERDHSRRPAEQRAERAPARGHPGGCGFGAHDRANLIRGSSRPHAISTRRLRTITRIVKYNRMPSIMGRS